ncbi:MAG: acyltransferase [Acetobacteraceae bacterium]
MAIAKSASVSLDLLRGAAALTVFLHHANWLGLDGGALAWFRRDVGHSAVVIFFVLSGYVIAATLRRGEGAVGYGIKRASRVYSVAVPAVVLTLLLDLASVHWQLPVNLPEYELHKPLVYVAVALAFAGDLWTLAVPAFSDNPYWSLNYEVWYYAAFGVAAFARGPWRVVGVGLVLAIMGPKLWLLFPIWLAGAWLFHRQQRRPLAERPARLVAVAAIALFLIVKALHVEEAINDAAAPILAAWPPLRFSQWFLGDYLVGVLTVALVYALGSTNVVFPLAVQRAIVGLAKVSFSLYLMHFPLLQFFAAMLPGTGPLPVVLALLGAVAFGLVFEPQRDLWRRVLTSSFAPRRA